jgi:hypothetical protein
MSICHARDNSLSHTLISRHITAGSAGYYYREQAYQIKKNMFDNQDNVSILKLIYFHFFLSRLDDNDEGSGRCTR